MTEVTQQQQQLVAQTEESTCNVGDLGSIPLQEDPLEEGMATHSSILAWRIPKDREAWRATVHGLTKSQTAQHSTDTQQVLTERMNDKHSK